MLFNVVAEEPLMVGARIVQQPALSKAVYKALANAQSNLCSLEVMSGRFFFFGLRCSVPF
jgi:hypothetical protein